jgi:peptidoglycan/xylan/chitin deacetylase (PgdA/CDA1 family)
MTPAVTVVTPARDAQATIGETLSSLAAQTFEDWEAIVVDDGSGDATGEAVERRARDDDRLRLIRQSARGPAAARNAAIEAARGEWLLFLDADDWIAPGALGKLVAAAGHDGTHGAICGYARVAADGRRFDFAPPRSPDAFDDLARYCSFAIHCCLVRAARVREVGGFDTSLRICEDWDLWQRIARTPGRFAMVDEVLAFYRLRPGSASLHGAEMLRNGLQVLARGFGPDARVPQPLTRYAEGLPVAGRRAAQVSFATYCASIEAGAGRPVELVFEILGHDHDPTADAGGLARTIGEALPTGQGLLPSDLPAVWDERRDAVAALLEHIEARTSSGMAARLRRKLEGEAARLWTGHAPRGFGETWCVRLDARDPVRAIEVPPGHQRLYCQTRLDEKVLGAVELPVVHDSVAAGVLADAIAAEHAWPILVAFLAERRREPLAADDPEAWGIFLRELWGRSDWPEPRFYDPEWDDADAPVEVRRVSTSARLPLHEELPPVVAVDGPAEVVLTVGEGLAVSLSLEAGGELSAQTLRAAFTTRAGFELVRLAVRDGILGRGMKGAPLRARLAETAATASPSTWLATVQTSAVLGRRAGDPPGTSGSRRALLPSVALDDLSAMADAAGEPIVTQGPAGAPVAYAPELESRDAANGSGPGPRTAHDPRGGAASRRVEFESLFAGRPDPWGYTSDYERVKYEQTLTLLPERPRRVLELACAEGHFTERLSEHADEVVAADFSRVALDRARARCAHCANVTFAELDLTADDLPGGFDAVFCSEVLFYVGDAAALERVAGKLAGALRPGGVLITAHANALVEDPGAPGFDWEVPFGALTIGRTLAATRGLILEVELEAGPYRIHRLRRPGGVLSRARGALSRPRRERVEAAPMGPDVAAHFHPEGGEAVAGQTGGAFARLPILMYHRVAPDGPEATRRWRVTAEELDAHLGFLASCGYNSVTLDDWHAATVERKPFPYRPVILTFDDGYADFAEYAWPVLRRRGFGATVFVVTGRVGGWNEWDAEYGDRAQLMDWDELRSLSAQGVEFGSHTARHRHLTDLGNDDVVRELTRSRTRLRRELGRPVRMLAYPYGDADRIVEHLAGACGYRYGLTAAPESATFDHRPLGMPRLEVAGGDGVEALARKLEEVGG